MGGRIQATSERRLHKSCDNAKDACTSTTWRFKEAALSRRALISP
jgi:hypothetical protein